MDSTEVTVTLKFDDNLKVPDMSIIPDGSILLDFNIDWDDGSITIVYEPPLEV